MSRRHSAEKREIIPDPKFGDIVVTKFMNSIMYDGKKSAAERIVYGAMEIIEGRVKTDPLEVFKTALENVAPAIEVRSRRVGGGPAALSRARPCRDAAGSDRDHRRWAGLRLGRGLAGLPVGAGGLPRNGRAAQLAPAAAGGTALHRGGRRRPAIDAGGRLR